MAVPVAFIHKHPRGGSVKLGGQYINMTKLASAVNCNLGYLSRILRGVRDPHFMSMGQALKISAALGMGLEEFWDELQLYIKQQAFDADAEYDKARAQRDDRLRSEVQRDAQYFRFHRIPPPRLNLG